jgi:phthiocerol/phenolphthiocerol synthesis type-I polyketide synthase E
MQEEILEEYKREVAKMNFHPMQYPFISNLTGVTITAEQAADPAYWANHLRQTVRYSDGIKSLLQKSNEFLFIEVGAGHTLSNLLKQQDAKQPASVTLVRSEKESIDDGYRFADRLGRLWEHGMNIDWLAYYKTGQMNKVSLPPYSFEPTRHIAEVEPFENGLGEASKVLYPTKNETLSNWLYFPIWKSAVIGPCANQQSKTILLFSLGDPFSVLLKEHLLQSGNRVIEVLMGEHYLKTANDQYNINPLENGHFRKLFGDLKGNGIVISDLVYTWTIAAGNSTPEMKADDRPLHLAYFSIAFIVQSLLHQELQQNPKITIITDSLHIVTGNEKGQYTQAPALAFVNTLAQEYGMSCYNIDVNLQEDPKQAVRDLITEIKNLNKDHIVAWRYGKRWMQDYERNKMPVNDKDALIRTGGVYIITGGTGNVGFALARYLATRDVKLIIIGRKKTEAASGTEIWLQRLQHLQQLNKDVQYYSVDVADQKSFAQVVEQIKHEVGAINGIIHAAGYINADHFETVEDVTLEKSLALFRAKMAGILNLYELFGNADTDFVWITSSLSSIVGGLGFSSYAAANLFMDHFVTAKTRELPNWKCIGLSEMLFTEEEMQQETEGNRKALKTTELSALFAWSTSLKSIPVIFETIESLPKRVQRVFDSPEEIYLDASSTGEKKSATARPDLSNGYVAPSTQTEAAMVAIIRNFFGFEQIGVTDNFFELGGDSLKAMILLKKIKATFGVHLSLKDFFALQNIQKMAIEIDERLWIIKGSEKNFVSII